MNVLSLFAGIGGLELGLERAGFTIVGQVELSDYCRAVLHKHWPDVPQYPDVTSCVPWWLSEPRPTVDVICGGFPCQDISTAGKRAGIIDGQRSSLWTYYAHAIRILRPRYVLVENVAAILIRGLDVVAADLAEIGYDLRWDCIPAADVGAPHYRNRWFGLAYPGGVGRERFRQAFARRWIQFSEESVAANGFWQSVPEPEIRGMAYGFPGRVDETRALGNAVVPQIGEHIGRILMDLDRELTS